MKYENLNEFIARTKTSKSSIYRFYRKNKPLFEETKLTSKRMFPSSHAKYFDSETMYDENKVLTQENNSMKNLINCLMDRNSLPSTLWHLEWSFFYTVAYKTERNQKSCYKKMMDLYEFLDKKYSDVTALRLFFTTEPFFNRTGYHNHFVIYVQNTKLHEAIINEIKDYFTYDRLETSAYNQFQAGLFYASKEGLVNEDWDIIGNNLKQEGLNYENKSK